MKSSDMDMAFELGADDRITKPFKVTQLGKIAKEKLLKQTKA